jgi:hypothetical protein
VEGEPFVPMKPVVEGMGLTWQGQHEKLKSSQRFSACIKEIVMQIPGDDQRRKVTCLPLRKLPGWLMTISPNKVKEEIRETVIAYQNECDDVLWDYWTKGKAENPRGNSPQQDLPPPHVVSIDVAKAAAEMLRLSDSSKARMLNRVLEAYGGDTGLLPGYTEDRLAFSLTHHLEKRDTGFTARTLNPILIDIGVLEQRERASTKTPSKKKGFKVLTDRGLRYGRNEVCPESPRESNPLYYEDMFDELMAEVDAYLDMMG